MWLLDWNCLFYSSNWLEIRSHSAEFLCSSDWGIGCLTPLPSYTGMVRRQNVYSSSSSECSDSCSTVYLFTCFWFFLCAHWVCSSLSNVKSFTGNRRLRCRTQRIQSPVSGWILYTGPSPILFPSKHEVCLDHPFLTDFWQAPGLQAAARCP